jgi:hypothetical protein
MAEADEFPAAGTPRPASPGPDRSKRWIRWPVALVLVWAALAAADVVFFHSGLNSRPALAARPAPSASVTARRHAGVGALPHPAPAITRRASTPAGPAASPRVLVPASASVLGPFGPGSGDNPQAAYLAIDADKATAWVTHWYRTAQFGGLQAGTGLLIDMGRPVRITSVQIILGPALGADLQLRTGDVPVLAELRRQASASDAGGTLRLNLARPEPARYLLIWFTLLPPDSSGTFRASVYNVRLEGTPCPARRCGRRAG